MRGSTVTLAWCKLITVSITVFDALNAKLWSLIFEME